MRAVIQRVSHASVTVENQVIGSIGKGFLILLGVREGDSDADAQLLAAKTAKLRIFTDEADKMNLSLTDVGGGALVVSQFTICADCKKGNRPSFTMAAAPDEANRLYELYMKELERNGVSAPQRGEFGASMQVELLNDGPVTILLDTDHWNKK